MKYLFSWLLFLLIVTGITFPLIPVPADIIFRLAMGLIVLIFSFLVSRNQTSLKAAISLLIFALAICAIPIALKGYDSVFMKLIFSGLLGYVSYHFLKFPSALLFVFWVLSGYFVIFYFSSGSLDEVFYMVKDGAVVSRNFVGIALLHCYLVYYALCVHKNIKPSHLPIWIIPIIAVMSSGVSSMFVSLLLLLGYLLHLFGERLIYAVIASFVFLLGAFVFQDFFIHSTLYDRITNDGVGLDRLIIWMNYYDQLDVKSIFVGFGSDFGFSDHVDGVMDLQNAHNSYLNLFSKVGIFSFPYLIFLAYVGYRIALINKMLFLVFAATLLRAFTDGYYFNSFLIDFVLFYLFMMTPAGYKFVCAHQTNIRSPRIALLSK